MLAIMKDLVANAAIMIAGFYFIGKAFTKPISKKSSVRDKISAGFLSGALGLVLMIFSIKVGDHVIVDLRHIPVLVISYYGGFITTIVSTLMIAFSRFFFGINEVALYAFLFMSLIGVSTGLISIYFRKGSYITILLMNILSMLFITIDLFITVIDKELYLNLLLFFWLIAIPSGLIATTFFRDIQKSKNQLNHYKNVAYSDFLTGLDNVRKFDSHLNELIKYSKGKEERFSLLLIDIDHFKKVNDTYGHDAGDAVLQQLGAILKQTVRSIDKVSRNGGEEFSVLLPNSSLQDSMNWAERIRKAVESQSFVLPNNEKLKITVSIGASSYPDTTPDTDEIFKQADNPLYQAKSSGRNRVCSLQVFAHKDVLI